MEEISERLICQRIRNRIIEVLEITSSLCEQEKYGGDEVICTWEDWVDDEKIGGFVEPVFSQSEQTALAEFHETWNGTADNTPNTMPPAAVLSKNKYWLQLTASAKETLAVFMLRGKFSDDSEIT